MSDKEEIVITDNLKDAISKFPHVFRYIEKFTKKHPMPEFRRELSRADKAIEYPNIIYPVGDPIFIHIFKFPGDFMHYNVIEPKISNELSEKYDILNERIVDIANAYPVPTDISQMKPVITKLFADVAKVGKPPKGVFKVLQNKMVLTQEEYETILYNLLRNRVGYGKLEPVFLDPYLEDIHCTGVGVIKMQHKVFDLVRTNIDFKDDIELNRFIIEMTERVERPASDSQSVVDAMMPDGSRGNFIYGRDVSLEGSSFTLRKFSEVPVSISEIVNWGTMSAQLAAYLWLCLEHGMNLFVCGETASGKTTSLNAICTFIKPDDKVYTVENTPEVTMPHDLWQHLLTREAGKSTDVTYQDLLIASLRSRPNYIIVGEIRGQEGNIAFQAMQCIKEGKILIPNKGLVDISVLFSSMKKKYGVQPLSKNKSKNSSLNPKESVLIEKEDLPVFVSNTDGKITSSIITHVHKMPKSQLVSLELNNGEHLEVTQNHKFIQSNLTEISAEELLSKDLSDTEVCLKNPANITWNTIDATLFDFIHDMNIKKDTTVKENILEFKSKYNKKFPSFIPFQKKYELQSSSKTISFSSYMTILKDLKKSLPKQVSVSIKGKKKTIVVPKVLSKQLLQSISLYIQKKEISLDHEDILKYILKISPTSLGKNIWTFSKRQLNIIVTSFETPKKIRISDKLWYSIGRLFGDDSLYIHKNTSFKDFRWQIKNKSIDEGITYKEQAVKEIPHTSLSSSHNENSFCTRLLGVSQDFVDFLIKRQFITLDFEKVNFSKAVTKHIPLKHIGNKYAFLAGLLDSDATIRFSQKQRTHEIKLALNVNQKNDSLLFSQLRFLKDFEHTLFPKINSIEFRYPSRLKKVVSRYKKKCQELGLPVRLSLYQKSKGIGARAEFSSKKDQIVFSTWRDFVSPYMFRKDKIVAIKSISKNSPKGNMPFKIKKEYYVNKNISVQKSLLAELSTLATICNKSLIIDNFQFKKVRKAYITKNSELKVLSAKKGTFDETFDISMKDKTYYLGGNNNITYIYDTGHPVMATFHAGNPRTMIQRLTGQPINVPITFIDNLNISLIQMAVSHKGKMVRRVLDVTEIERYYAPANQVVTRQVFQWDPVEDKHIFKGMNNSYILENKIAKMAGYSDTRLIYEEMKKRETLILKLIEYKLFNYFEVWDLIKNYFYGGESTLPFTLDE